MTNEPTEAPEQPRAITHDDVAWQLSQLSICAGHDDSHVTHEGSDTPADWPKALLDAANNEPDLLLQPRNIASLDELHGCKAPLGVVTKDGGVAVIEPEGHLQRIRRYRVCEKGGEWRSVHEHELAALLPPLPATFVSAEDAMPLAALAHKTPQGRVRALLTLEAQDVGVVLIYAASAGILSLVVPVGVQSLVNNLGLASLGQPIAVLSLLILVGLVLAGALRAFQYQVIELLQRRMFARAAADITLRLTRTDPALLRSRGGASLINRFLDVTTMQKTISALMLEGLAFVLQAAIGILLLGFYHPAMLAFGLFLCLALLGIVFGVGRNAINTSIGESKAKYALVDWLQSLADQPDLYAQDGGDRVAMEQTDTLLGKWASYRNKHFKIVYRQVLSGYALQACAAAILLGAGGWLVLQRQLSLGQLVAAELVVANLLASLQKLGKIVESYYDLVSSTDKVGEVLDIPARGLAGRSLPAAPAALELKQLRAESRRSSNAPAVNLDLAPCDQVSLTGDCVVLSPLLETIALLRPARSGVICVANLDTRALRARSVRTAVTYVGRAQLAAGTIRDYLRGATSAKDETLRAALRIVELDEQVHTLEHGFATPLLQADFTEQEEKRLAIARALVTSPAVLLIDHALDGFAPALTQKILKTFKDRRFTLLVATARDEIAQQLPRRFALSSVGLKEVA